jgi:hypothetical protein
MLEVKKKCFKFCQLLERKVFVGFRFEGNKNSVQFSMLAMILFHKKNLNRIHQKFMRFDDIVRYEWLAKKCSFLMVELINRNVVVKTIFGIIFETKYRKVQHLILEIKSLTSSEVSQLDHR